MASLPLWLSGEGRTIRLAICRNCGKAKVLTRPCSLDHLAAILEFTAHRSRAGS